MIEQRICANGEELPKLEDYLQGCQDMATHLSSLIEAAEVLDHDGTCLNGVAALLKASGEVANKLTSKLDSVNLPG